MTQHTDRQREEAPDGEARSTEAPRQEAPHGEALRALAAAELLSARERTTLLTSVVDDADLVKQHSPLMSPLVWDLAHVANQEELWLLRAVGGRDPMHPEIDPLYDAFEHPRAKRPTLPLLTPAGGAPLRPRGPRPRARPHRAGAAARGAAQRVRRRAHRARVRVRVRHGRAARGAARRDDARHPSAAVGHGGAVRSPAAARPRGRGVAARRGPRARRPVHHGHLGRAVGA